MHKGTLLDNYLCLTAQMTEALEGIFSYWDGEFDKNGSPLGELNQICLQI